MRSRSLTLTLAGLLAAGTAGAQSPAPTSDVPMRVSKDVPVTSATPATPAAAPMTPAPAAGMNAAMAPEGAAPAAPPRAPGAGETPEEMYTDPKIAAVASASNFGEIDPSQIALERGEAQAVKDFARLMIDHHTRLEQGMRALLERKGVRPEDNALSLQLKRNGPPTLEMLRLKSGREFDDAYVLQQIGSHQMTLQTLDTSLIPAARDPELKAMLRDTARPLVADHLQRVLAIHTQMMAATATR